MEQISKAFWEILPAFFEDALHSGILSEIPSRTPPRVFFSEIPIFSGVLLKVYSRDLWGFPPGLLGISLAFPSEIFPFPSRIPPGVPTEIS